MKLLYYVDFDHYEQHGKAITGSTYRKLEHGPVPKEAQTVIEQMAKKELVKPVKADRAGYPQHRLIALAKFDAAHFSGDELQTLERVAQKWEDATAAQIEAASHAEAPWAATAEGKVIDYELAHFRHPTGEEPLDAALSKSHRLAKYVAALR
jgi:uncharacterized phage-associated protein